MDRLNINKFAELFEQWSYIKYGTDLHCIEMLNAQISYLENELEKENQENYERNKADDMVTDRMIEEYKEANIRG